MWEREQENELGLVFLQTAQKQQLNRTKIWYRIIVFNGIIIYDEDVFTVKTRFIGPKSSINLNLREQNLLNNFLIHDFSLKEKIKKEQKTMIYVFSKIL